MPKNFSIKFMPNINIKNFKSFYKNEFQAKSHYLGLFIPKI